MRSRCIQDLRLKASGYVPGVSPINDIGDCNMRSLAPKFSHQQRMKRQRQARRELALDPVLILKHFLGMGLGLHRGVGVAQVPLVTTRHASFGRHDVSRGYRREYARKGICWYIEVEGRLCQLQCL